METEKSTRARAMPKAVETLRTTERPVMPVGQALSHNLLGQKLGKKGRDTRERILAAAERLLASPDSTQLSLSAVAREASLAMTTLYLYFADLTELLIAILEPIMASAEDAYIAHLRVHWPDEQLDKHCVRFVQDFHAFWDRHSRILHLRNSYTAGPDHRMVQYRVTSSQPLIDVLLEQMDRGQGDVSRPSYGIAVALLTGLERLVTVATDTDFAHVLLADPLPNVPNLLLGQAKLFELGIRHCRT